jgi:hypothetical protein
LRGHHVPSDQAALQLSPQHTIGVARESDAEFIYRRLAATTNVQSKVFLDARHHVDLNAGAAKTSDAAAGTNATASDASAAAAMMLFRAISESPY